MRKTGVLFLALFCATGPSSARTEETIHSDINIKIRDAGMYGSEIMRTMHFLTDVHGPRLTGSPNHRAAAEWAIRQMEAWGMKNGHLEPWDFAHPGWLNERLSAHIVSPVKDHLVCEALAWTPGTDGVVVARAILIAPPERPTAEELDQYLSAFAEKVRGRAALVGKHTLVPVTLTPAPRRRDDQQARAAYDPRNPAAARFGGPRRQQPEPGPGRLSANQITMRIDEFLKTNGARIIEEDAKKSAIAIASAVYHLAMREEMPPRFSKETMPPPPPPARTTESQQP